MSSHHETEASGVLDESQTATTTDARNQTLVGDHHTQPYLANPLYAAEGNNFSANPMYEYGYDLQSWAFPQMPSYSDYQLPFRSNHQDPHDMCLTTVFHQTDGLP